MGRFWPKMEGGLPSICGYKSWWNLGGLGRRRWLGVGGCIVRFLQEVIQHFQIAIDRIGVGAEIALEFPQLVGGRLGFAAKVIHVHLPAHEGVDHGVVFAGRFRISRQQLLAYLLGDIRAPTRQAKCSGQVRVGFHQGRKGRKIGWHGNLSGRYDRFWGDDVRAKRDNRNLLARDGDLAQRVALQDHAVRRHGNHRSGELVAILQFHLVGLRPVRGGEGESNCE